MADGRRGQQQPGELLPAVASLAVSVITVTVLLSVIAHGASADRWPGAMEPRLAQAGTGSWAAWAELSTQLSFPEIAAEMFLSRTTIKSEALSIYRKLGASSRSQAVFDPDIEEAADPVGIAWRLQGDRRLVVGRASAGH